MSTLASGITSKALAGLIVLVPVAILVLAGLEIWALLEDVAVFAELELPFPPFVNALIFVALISLALFLTCLLTGLLMSTGPGKRLGQFLQQTVADKIPLLGLIRKLTMSLTGSDKSQLKPAEVDLNGSGTCIYGFLVEELPDGRCVVFIPSAPAIMVGQSYLVPAERVKLLDVPITTVVNAITQWGAGASEIYKPR